MLENDKLTLLLLRAMRSKAQPALRSPRALSNCEKRQHELWPSYCYSFALVFGFADVLGFVAYLAASTRFCRLGW